MRKITICIIIAAAAFWAAQDGRNAPPRPVEQAQAPIAPDDGPRVVQHGGTGTASELTVTIPGGGGGTVFMGSGGGGGGAVIYEHGPTMGDQE